VRIACNARPPGRPSAQVPLWLGHHFWNADPAALRLPLDEQYVATRLLRSGAPDAMAWAASHLSAESVRGASRARGVGPAERAALESLSIRSPLLRGHCARHGVPDVLYCSEPAIRAGSPRGSQMLRTVLERRKPSWKVRDNFSSRRGIGNQLPGCCQSCIATTCHGDVQACSGQPRPTGTTGSAGYACAFLSID